MRIGDENAQERQYRNGAARPGLHMKRVMRILGVGGLMEAIRTKDRPLGVPDRAGQP